MASPVVVQVSTPKEEEAIVAPPAPPVARTASSAHAEASLPWWVRGEAVRSILAYLVVPFGLFVISAMWIVRGAEEAQHVAAVLIGLIGGVLGYYFGSRGVDQAQRAADTAESRKEQLKEEAADAADRVLERLEASEAKVEALRAKAVTLSRLVVEARKDPELRRSLDRVKAKLDGGES